MVSDRSTVLLEHHLKELWKRIQDMQPSGRIVTKCVGVGIRGRWL